MNISKYLLLVCSFILFVINFFRAYIVFCGWRKLDRMPNFKDIYTAYKPVFIDRRTDEFLLFGAHLLTPLLILIMALLFFRIVVKNKEGLWLLLPLFIVVFEFIFRGTPGYGYLMTH